jgi:hypothetical protein
VQSSEDLRLKTTKKAEPKDPAFKNCFSKIKSEVLEKDLSYLSMYMKYIISGCHLPYKHNRLLPYSRHY